MPADIFYRGNPRRLKFTLKNSRTGVGVDGASATWSLLTASGAALPSPATGSMSAVGDGVYEGVVDSTYFSSFADGTMLLAKVQGTSDGVSFSSTLAVVVLTTKSD